MTLPLPWQELGGTICAAVSHPVTLGTTSPRCDVVMTATVEAAVADAESLRAAVAGSSLVTWGQQPFPSTESEPGGAPTFGPTPPAAC